MTEPIVCATRGGRTCHRTQEQAIELAKEQSAELIFLFVADPSFAGPMDERLKTVLIDELERLGKSLLYVAQERAREQGLAAQTAVRHGPAQQIIEEFVRQVNASTLMLGSPQTNLALQTFSAEALNDFAATVRQTTGVKVVIVN